LHLQKLTVEETAEFLSAYSCNKNALNLTLYI